MKFSFIAAMLVFGCSGCAVSDTVANTSANYDYKGDITRDGGTDCWYYCLKL
jgi:hypothetical protein